MLCELASEIRDVAGDDAFLDAKVVPNPEVQVPRGVERSRLGEDHASTRSQAVPDRREALVEDHVVQDVAPDDGFAAPIFRQGSGGPNRRHAERTDGGLQNCERLGAHVDGCHGITGSSERDGESTGSGTEIHDVTPDARPNQPLQDAPHLEDRVKRRRKHRFKAVLVPFSIEVPLLQLAVASCRIPS